MSQEKWDIETKQNHKQKNHSENIMIRLLKERYPTYDENRYYYQPGDIVQLKNQAVVVIMEHGIQEQQVFVIQTGFGMKKGENHLIDMDQFPYHQKYEYQRPPLNIKSGKEIKWELGDVVEDRGNVFLLYEKCQNDSDFFAMVMQPKKELFKTHPIGSKWRLLNRHKNYVI